MRGRQRAELTRELESRLRVETSLQFPNFLRELESLDCELITISKIVAGAVESGQGIDLVDHVAICDRDMGDR